MLVLDNFDFDQVSKDLNYLETNIHVYLEKSQRINFKTVNTSAESLSDKNRPKDLLINSILQEYPFE
jgi:nicotinate-nucleotide pyrophosphorylase